MPNFYADVNVNAGGSGDRSPLPEGNYNHRTKKQLYIFKLLDPKQVGDDKKTTRHTFVVGSDQEKGSAFLKIDLQNHWLLPEAVALAFRKKGADGQREAIQPAVMAQLDTNRLAALQKQIQFDAEEKVDAANTPEEARHDAVEKAISNTLLQIQINVGTIFRLCDWAGKERDPLADLGSFEQVEFEGAIKHQILSGKINAEVSVHSKPVNGKAGQKRVDRSVEFDPAQMG